MATETLRKKKVSHRPQFRVDAAMAIALNAYCSEQERTPSQAMRLALRQFIPAKYFDQARRNLNGRKKAK